MRSGLESERAIWDLATKIEQKCQKYTLFDTKNELKSALGTDRNFHIYKFSTAPAFAVRIPPDPFRKPPGPFLRTMPEPVFGLSAIRCHA